MFINKITYSIRYFVKYIYQFNLFKLFKERIYFSFINFSLSNKSLSFRMLTTSMTKIVVFKCFYKAFSK